MEDEASFLSALERLAAKKEREDETNAINEANREQYKQSLNAVADTDHGRFVLRVLINQLRVFMPDGKTPQRRYESSLLRDVYMQGIRPYLEKEIRIRLENE